MRRQKTHDQELFTALTYNIFILEREREKEICAFVDVHINARVFGCTFAHVRTHTYRCRKGFVENMSRDGCLPMAVVVEAFSGGDLQGSQP